MNVCLFDSSDAMRICNGSGSGWCPAPHCDGPLKPPSCKHSSGGGSSGGSGGGGSSGGGSSSSSSGGGGDGEAKYASYEYSESDGDSVYAGTSAYEFDSYSEKRVSDGTHSTSGSKHPTSRFNFFWYLLALTGVSALVGGFLMKKRVSRLKLCVTLNR